MKTVLVTGGSGFIGEKIVDLLLNKGYKVISLDRSKKDQYKQHHSLTNIVYDLSDDISKLIIPYDIDVLCHSAAYIPKNMADLEEAKKCIEINALGTLKLLQFCEQKEIKHFIYFNSGNSYLYGDIPREETDILYPVDRATYYLNSKLAGEIYVKHFDNKNIINASIFRLSSVYGNSKKPDLVVNLLNKAIEDKEIQINNKNYKTDFVYIDDILKVVEYSIKNNIYGVFNIGSGERKSLLDVIEGIRFTTKFKVKNLVVNNEESKDVGFSALNISKLKEMIQDYQPTQLFEGIKKIYFDLKK